MNEDSATHKNILAIKDHSMRTREIVRDLEKLIQGFTNQNRAQQTEIDMLKKQIQTLQIKLFSGGATS
ncbi:hypothetical protein KAU11_12420 [Candidatus Babeliales bacterium]|nr:hypothetical protein [Candidatus Babeliales bacterium]